MLSWIALIGKLVELCVTKIAGKQLDLALDQRRRAAKAFLRLHESLEQLEQATRGFIYQSRNGLSSENQRVLYRAPIENIARDADDASNTFFGAFEDLKQVISLYDEGLYKILWGVHLGKQIVVASLLQDVSTFKNSFKISANPQSVFSIHYLAPSKELLDINFERLYQSFQEINLQDAKADISYSPESSQFPKWPKNLLFYLVQQPTFSTQFADNDKEHIAKFTEMLEEHVKLLQSARQSLAQFIKENFSLDDLLNSNVFSRHY